MTFFSHFPLERTTSRIPDRQANKSRAHPEPNFGESRFSESSQIPFPVKMFCFFPNPAPYFGQILDPENTLPDPGQPTALARFDSPANPANYAGYVRVSHLYSRAARASFSPRGGTRDFK